MLVVVLLLPLSLPMYNGEFDNGGGGGSGGGTAAAVALAVTEVEGRTAVAVGNPPGIVNGKRLHEWRMVFYQKRLSIK